MIFQSRWSLCMSLCGRVRRKGQPLDWSGLAKTAEKSSPLAFQCWMALLKLRRSTRPIMSSNLRKPNPAITRRMSSATKVRKRTTYSALPWNLFRRSGSCVAMPTGQVPRWHFRIRMQPSETRAEVPKPNRSAPSMAPITTSRPVRIWPSHCTRMRSRRPFNTSVCWVSARPISQGVPACLIDDRGLAPVPPSWPLISTSSA